MVYSNNFSDYGSGNTSNDSSMSFGGQDRWPGQEYQDQTASRQKKRASSYVDLVMGRCSIEDVMQEFRMNGSDSPYSPDDDRPWTHRAEELIGMGPSSAYLRQKSWPEPERSPAVRLPRPAEHWPAELASTPLEQELPPISPAAETITPEQIRVLSSLPNNVLYSLLRGLEQRRDRDDARAKPKRHNEECRFCKNNGERESYYRSHALKDARGRVACPVLRAFVCKRCGASGDHAHTIKYCPLSTNEERIKSAAMMRSVRLASGRRRAPAPPAPRADYVIYGENEPYAIQDSNLYSQYGDAAPLDPKWAALEQKLLL
ncbi:protein nanos-like [Ostrinia nubilalis]|uniref:protein nanos-like n=1 Tax=Ostrinia nubilalis TaxID=29057 RepID=UPI00308254B3